MLKLASTCITLRAEHFSLLSQFEFWGCRGLIDSVAWKSAHLQVSLVDDHEAMTTNTLDLYYRPGPLKTA